MRFEVTLRTERRFSEQQLLKYFNEETTRTIRNVNSTILYDTDALIKPIGLKEIKKYREHLIKTGYKQPFPASMFIDDREQFNTDMRRCQRLYSFEIPEEIAESSGLFEETSSVYVDVCIPYFLSNFISTHIEVIGIINEHGVVVDDKHVQQIRVQNKVDTDSFIQFWQKTNYSTEIPIEMIELIYNYYKPEK